MWVVISSHQPSPGNNFLWVFEAGYSVFHVLHMIPDHSAKRLLDFHFNNQRQVFLTVGDSFVINECAGKSQSFSHSPLYLEQSGLLIWPPTVIQNLPPGEFFKKQEAEHLGTEDHLNYLFLWNGKDWEKKRERCVLFFFNKFIYFWLHWVFVDAQGFLQLQREWAALPCSVWASHCGGFSCCGARALDARASVVAARGLSSCGSRELSSCGTRAELLSSMWDLPRPGLEPVSPALAGRFLTTVPPKKPERCVFEEYFTDEKR